MKLRKKEKPLTMAAAKAGMARNTARKYLKSGKLPSESWPERSWRTRPDPYETVWPEVEEILKRSPSVEETAVFDHLNRIHEGNFEERQVRTLQRRIKQWRARHGELKGVMFPQRHEPGHQAQSDFTFMNVLGVTIQGQPFPHLLYHFVLTYSNWETTTLCSSESFESLSLGLQNALWELLDHYGMKRSRTQAGKAHENGDVEQAHHRRKRAIERRNAGRQKRLDEELKVMRRLPNRRLEDFVRFRVKVSPSSTIRVRKNTYSVDSRLIREQVEVRVWADHLEVRYASQLVARMPRLRGQGKHRIEYRHVIHSLVRKPGAFARYRWRADLFPGVLFRVAYDELREDCPGTADRQYLGILELAANEGEQRVSQALKKLIERGCRVRLQVVKETVIEPASSTWQVQVPQVDIQVYDRLLNTPDPEVRP